MSFYNIRCDCPKGHNIAGTLYELPGDGEPTGAQFDAQFKILHRELLREFCMGEIADVCPHCGAPFKTWVYIADSFKEGLTREYIQARMTGAEDPKAYQRSHALARRAFS